MKAVLCPLVLSAGPQFLLLPVPEPVLLHGRAGAAAHVGRVRRAHGGPGLDTVWADKEHQVCGLFPCYLHQDRQDWRHHHHLRPHRQDREGLPDDRGALHPLYLQVLYSPGVMVSWCHGFLISE